MADIFSSYDITNYRSRLTNLLDKTANSTPATLITSPLNYSSPVVPKADPNISADGKALQANGGMPVVEQKPVVKTTVVQPTNTGGSYSVVAGDTLGAIASRNGMTLQQVLALNPSITDPNKIGVGQKINLGTTKTTPTDTNLNPDGTPKTTVTEPTLTPEQKIAKDNADIATKAGQAGLSVDEYQKLMNDRNSVSKEESDRIAKELGITALEGEVFKKPSQTSQQMFQTAYDTAGLAEIKAKVNTLLEEIAKDRAQLADATGAIDENPFLTESSRVGRGKRLLDQAETRINNKLEQINQLNTLYTNGVNEITAMVTRNTNDFGTNQAIDQAKLNYLIKKAEVQADQLKTSKSTASDSAYLSARADTKKPDLVGSDNTGYYRYDGTLKKFVQVIPPSAKAGLDIENQRLQNEKLKKDIENVEAGGEFKPSTEQKALVGRFLNTPEGKALYAGQTLTSADILAIQSDPALFYAVLQKANEAGVY